VRSLVLDHAHALRHRRRAVETQPISPALPSHAVGLRPLRTRAHPSEKSSRRALTAAMHRTHALDPCIGPMHFGPLHWTHALDPCIGPMHRTHALDPCIGPMHWTHASGPCIGPMCIGRARAATRAAAATGTHKRTHAYGHGHGSSAAPSAPCGVRQRVGCGATSTRPCAPRCALPAAARAASRAGR
jgi:hypothetical protein